jgi:hypothetical protein
VKAGEFGFTGIASRDGLLPEVTTIEANRSRLAKTYKDWDDVVARWRASLEAIGAGYASGDARVDPRNGALTCKLCDQRTFCRVGERQREPAE